MSSNDGVSNCYVFKSQLQEYAQKVGIATPVYETIKEGPSHEPSFRSTVIVNNVRYDSLLGFFNRKAAEQSAAEVALVQLANSGEIDQCISQPVHETGLCKNLLQEYAQKMNYAIPSYTCQKAGTLGRVPLFSCTVEIGGIKYIGASAKTKKEAEIKAARTALLAIRSAPSKSTEKHISNSVYTVLPCKKKAMDSGIKPQETDQGLKPRKGQFKKRTFKKRRAGDRGKKFRSKTTPKMEVNMDGPAGPENSGVLAIEGVKNPQYQEPNFEGNEREVSNMEGALVPYNGTGLIEGQLTPNFCQNDQVTPRLGITAIFSTDALTALVREVNKIPGVGHSSTCQGEVSSVMDGLNQIAYRGNAGSNQG